MKLVNDQHAVTVSLTDPTDNGFILLAAEIGRWAGPLALPSRPRRTLIARLGELCATLAQRDDVIEATVFRGAVRPPGEGSELLARAGVRPARHDLVVLVRTTTVAAIDAVRADSNHRAMEIEIERTARHGYRMAAGNAARIADVDHTGGRWFLFNYFHCDDPDTVYDVWRYTAGWFQRHTALPDSTLLRPLPGQPTDYSVVNHASWPTLRAFLPSLLFRRTFRTFVLANFKANDVAASRSSTERHSLNHMRIALAQIKSGTDPTANLAAVRENTVKAAAEGARLVVFPEATMCRFGVKLAPVAQPLDGPWADGVRQVAADTGVTVIAGMFCPAPDGRVTNTLIAAGPDTDTHYDKIHLYDAYGFTESRTVAPGDQPVLIDVDGVPVGLTTCYDLRFPELYVELARRGARICTVSASWGSGPGKLEQWTLLARARAVDIAGVIVAVDQAYPGDEVAALGPTGVGGSLASSPYGEVVAAAGADPQLLICDVDPGETVDTARDTLAVLRNRVLTQPVGPVGTQSDRAESRA